MANNREDMKFYFYETDYEELKDMAPEQRAEYVMLMCKYFFDGIDTNPDDIQDKDVRKPWRYRRQSLKSSLKNIKDYERKKAKNTPSTCDDIQPNKGFDNKPKRERRTCFVDMRGKLSIYAPNIYTKTTVHNTELIQYKNQLNNVINTYKDCQADAYHCQKLWEELSRLKGFAPSVDSEEDMEGLNEIMDSIEAIGNQIAYIAKDRSGVILKDYGKSNFDNTMKSLFIYFIQKKDENGIHNMASCSDETFNNVVRKHIAS